MSQPKPYRRGYDFSDAGGAQPPGGPLDDELDDVGLTLSQVLRNLALLQRDDTALRNGIVGIDALDSRVLGLISGGTFSIGGTWETGTPYPAGAFLTDDGAIYLVMEAHTSTSIVDDLAAGRIAKALQNEQGTRLRDDFVGNAVQTAYSLSQSPARPTDVEVYVDGALILPADYVQTGATVTFDVAPANGAEISIFSITWATAPPIQTLVDAVGDRNTEISAATDFLQEVADNGGAVFVDDLAASGGDDMVGLVVGGTLRDAVRVLTPAMFGVPNAGMLVDEDADVTTQLEAMALASRTLEYPVLFAARKYVYSTEALNFGGNVSGSGTGTGSTLLSCTNTGTDAYTLKVSAPGSVVENLRLDGNVSDDPETWDAGNYDDFTGAQGLLVDADEVTVRNVVAQNCRRAGIKVQAGRKGWVLENVRTNRTRGNFGDGFFIVGTEQGKLTNCRAYDFTRIGFVVDSYGDPDNPSIQIGLDNCRAEYGHDASILYGGFEYNSGYWYELAGHVLTNNCHAKNTGSRGFLAAAGAAILGVSVARFTFTGCTVDGAEDGFITYGLGGIPIATLFSNCFAKVTGNSAFALGGGTTRDVVRVVKCGSILSGTSNARSSVKVSLGETYIDGFEETWAVTNATQQDDPAVHYAGLGHFADAAGKVVVRDWRTFDNTGTRVPSSVKFLSQAASSLDLTMERMWIKGLALTGVKLRTKDVDWTRLGSIDFTDTVLDTGIGLETDSIFALTLRSTTKRFLIKDYLFDFTTSGKWLAFFNASNTDPVAKAALSGCQFVKNYETGNRAVRLEAAPGAPAAAAGGSNLLLDHCSFTNTGGTTSNEAVTIVSDADAGGLVHGQGNKKSSTITNTATAGRTSTSFSCTPWGA